MINICTIDEDEQRHMLFPYASEREDTVFRENYHFAHYSSAENIYKILSTETLYMFNADHMIDDTEITFGMKKLFSILSEKKFSDAFSRLFDRLGFSFTIHCVMDIVRRKIHVEKNNIYIACLTEHRTPEEQMTGRHFMWREYAHENGVAIDLNNQIIDSADIKESPFFLYSPVIYVDENNDNNLREEVQRFLDVWDNVTISHPLNRGVEEGLALSYLITVLLISLMSIKSTEYTNEQEWRIVLYDNPFVSPMLRKESWFEKNKWLERGTCGNENIFKLHLNKLFSSHLSDRSSLPFLIERIIVNSKDTNSISKIRELANRYRIDMR